MAPGNQQFWSLRDGNVALMFAILVVPLLVGAGVGIDLMRAGQARTELAEAADAGLLAAARARLRDETMTDEALTEIARKYFDGNRPATSEILIDDFALDFDPATKTASLSANARVKTTLLGVVGKNYVEVDIETEARVVKPRALEVALALDNTFSMNGAKLQSLKDAATTLVEAIMGDADGAVKVGLVPFARHVNIGVSRGGEAWVSVPANDVWTHEVCVVDAAAATAAGCSEQSATCNWDGSSYACQKWQCPSGDPPESCAMATDPTSWQGCVGSRLHPLNVEDASFLSNPVPGVLNTVGWPDCPSELTTMTADEALVKTRIAAMTADGETYVPGGLFWAQSIISSEIPFSEGMTYAEMANQGAVKAIVLMTDGENTASPDGGAHYGDDEAQADAYTLELCSEIKSKGVILYTIAFEVSDAATETMLKSCATNADAYFDADGAGELMAAFGEIGNNLQELALVK